MKKKLKVEIYFRDNYLTMIKNSVGSKMFRNTFAKVNSKKQDITKNGLVSCARFVSCILLLFDLIKKPHLTVNSTIKDMEEFGWYKIKRVKNGAILLWEGKEYPGGWYEKHKHIGFYIGNNKAISHSTSIKLPSIHHWTYNGKRKVEAIYWHKKLDKK